MNGGFRKAVFFVLLIGVTIAGYRYMIIPANKSLTKAKERVELKLQKLANLSKATTVAEDLSGQLEQLQKAIDFFESKLPPTSEIHKVLEQVTVIAQNQGLEPKKIKTMPNKENNGYIEQPLQMQLKGDFKSFYSFMLELEKLPRIMKIREMNLNKQQRDEGTVTADFIVSIFFQEEMI